MRIPVVMLLVLGAAAASRVACASTYGPDFPYHRIDQAKVGIDVVPPAAPVAEVTKIWRADPPAMLADGQSVWYDNTGLGTLHMRLTGMLDDDTPAELMGLRVVPLDSVSRFGCRSGPFTDFCPRYVPAEHCWTYRLVWPDGATVTHEPIRERLLLFAVDAAGNVSATADTIEVTDPGRP